MRPVTRITIELGLDMSDPAARAALTELRRCFGVYSAHEWRCAGELHTFLKAAVPQAWLAKGLAWANRVPMLHRAAMRCHGNAPGLGRLQRAVAGFVVRSKTRRGLPDVQDLLKPDAFNRVIELRSASELRHFTQAVGPFVTQPDGRGGRP